MAKFKCAVEKNLHTSIFFKRQETELICCDLQTGLQTPVWLYWYAFVGMEGSNCFYYKPVIDLYYSNLLCFFHFLFAFCQFAEERLVTLSCAAFSAE